MNAICIPPLILAVIAFYVGLYHVTLFFRRRRWRDLSFALTCFCIGLYDVCCAGDYACATPLQAVVWQRYQVLILSLLSIFLLWFLLEYTEKKIGPVDGFFLVCFVVAAFIQLIDRSELTWRIGRPAIKIVEIPWLHARIQYNEAGQGPITDLQTVILLGFFLYLYRVGYFHYWKPKAFKGSSLFLAIILFSFTAINDVLVSAGWYHFIYLMEYGFTAMVLVMSYSLMSELVEAGTIRQSLEESEVRFRTLFEQAGDYILILDPFPGPLPVIADANDAACRMHGYTREELIGMSIAALDCELSRERIAELDRRFRDGETVMIETSHRRKDGSEFPVETCTKMVSLPGKPPLIFSTERDITERRRAEAERRQLQEQLGQAQKMESVGRLAGGVAHDFNNMLGVILGHAELALDDLSQDHPLREDLLEIQSAALRSADLTRQLLAFARKQAISPRVLDLNATVECMLKMLQRLIGENIHLIWRPGPGLWPVKMDPAQIDQILANLSVNARDAINGVGRLTIETGNAIFTPAECPPHSGFLPGDYVMLAVADTGAGMTRETLEHLFEPFFTTKGLGKGTGLGLATVYGAVKQNQGFIHVDSKPGKGTNFRIFLPRVPTLVAAPAAAAERPVNGHQTLLIVEDEESILSLGKTVLEKYGYTVLAAPSPAEALELIDGYEGPIDLLVTDVVMPGMNGKELFARLVARRPGVRALFMSGYTADVIAHQGILDEGVEFLQKPFSGAILVKRVQELLER